MKTKSNLILYVILFLGICSSSFWCLTLLIKDNPHRLSNNKVFNYYKDEGFCILKKAVLGNQQEADWPDRREIGPLPEGKFISSYVMEGKDNYSEPYKYKTYIDEPYYTYEPIYDEFGFKLLDRAVTHYKLKEYWKTGYRYKEFKYVRNFSVYDISNQISFFENTDSAYKRLMNEFESKITEYDYHFFSPFNEKKGDIAEISIIEDIYKKRNKALYYLTKSLDGTSTCRCIYFANKKAYVLEIKAKKNSIQLANEFLSNITTINLSGFNTSVVTKIIISFLLFLSLFFVFVHLTIKQYRKQPVKNHQARKILLFALYMTALNAIIVLIILVRLFINSDYYLPFFGGKYIILNVMAFLEMATLILMDLLICISLYIKSKKTFEYYYLIPVKIRPFIENKLDNIQEKKTLVSLLYYPLYILGAIPLGIFSLLYVIPFFIIIIICIEIRHLYRWINNDTISTEQEEILFVDYYVVLDLKKDANTFEVEKAFNSAIAKYNSANGNPLYGKQFFNNVQEAYAIIGSANQLRPEYDKEYEAYKAGNNTNYSYTNKQLENEIAIIRSRLNNTKKRKREIKINIIMISFILLLTFLLIIQNPDVYHYLSHVF